MGDEVVSYCELVAVQGGDSTAVPAVVANAWPAAQFAWEEFFEGELANAHTRLAYERAARRFLGWCRERGLDLARVSPAHVGRYFAEHPGSVPTKKQHLAATGGMNALITAAWNVVAPGGQLILWCYDGHFEEIAPQLSEYRQLLVGTGHGFTKRISGPVVFWVSERKAAAEL